ncbi:hypothetical protein C2G38_2056812 [Gigaspora rosea]|uniref:Uncharacterized protein n=1 Tax=Gigaspora rosea TaxID=44941 RepID=A0A397W5M2_9GLOM|nr:hypothetical protein C2G38_2056812 [Gigaspora rosea]
MNICQEDSKQNVRPLSFKVYMTFEILAFGAYTSLYIVRVCLFILKSWNMHYRYHYIIVYHYLILYVTLKFF